jgi:hypothetical protein
LRWKDEKLEALLWRHCGTMLHLLEASLRSPLDRIIRIAAATETGQGGDSPEDKISASKAGCQCSQDQLILC